MAMLDIIGKRIERHRSGGVDGPDPTGFLLSVSEAGNALLIVHDLGLPEGEPISVVADGGSIRLFQGERAVLQTRDEGNIARSALASAGKIQVLETSEERGPLRLHEARLSDQRKEGPGA